MNAKSYFTSKGTSSSKFNVVKFIFREYNYKITSLLNLNKAFYTSILQNEFLVQKKKKKWNQ